MQTGTKSPVVLVAVMDKSSIPGTLSVSNESSSPSSSLCLHCLAKSLESFEKQMVACLQPWIVFALQRQHFAGGPNLAEAQRHYHDNVISDIEQGLSTTSPASLSDTCGEDVGIVPEVRSRAPELAR